MENWNASDGFQKKDYSRSTSVLSCIFVFFASWQSFSVLRLLVGQSFEWALGTGRTELFELRRWR